MASVAPSPAVGQRVADKEGFRGSVAYVGPVVTSKKASTVYAGIVWDDATRGKHDGSVTAEDGTVTRYFTCPNGQGSFVRAAVVQQGVDFLQALADRYEDDTEGGGVYETTSGRPLEVMLVGDHKIRSWQRLSKLWNVSLRDSLVRSFATDSIATVAPNIRELDLRGNLLSALPDLGVLGRQLPQLTMLNLGENVFQPSSAEDAAGLAGCFPALRVLVLSGTKLPWSQVQQLEAAAPLLQELHLCRNAMAGFDAPVTGFPALEVLNLSENIFSDWGEIVKLAALPAMKRLLLNANLLTHLASPDAAPTGGAGASEAVFPALTSLTLSDNVIATWEGIEAIRAYPGVTALRFQNNPLTASTSPSQARMALIARLAQLETLNGSAVRGRERDDAEKFYVRSPPEGFEATQRFTDLVAKHGSGMAAAGGGGSGTLADSVVKVTLRSMAAGSSEADPVTKRLPLTMTVQALKQLVARLFKCDVSLTRLSVRVATDAYPALLEEDLRTLSYYAVMDGSEILVEEVDPREAERLADTAARELADRMAAQEASAAALLAARQLAVEQHKAAAGAAATSK